MGLINSFKRYCPVILQATSFLSLLRSAVISQLCRIIFSLSICIAIFIELLDWSHFLKTHSFIFLLNSFHTCRFINLLNIDRCGPPKTRRSSKHFFIYIFHPPSHLISSHLICRSDEFINLQMCAISWNDHHLHFLPLFH